MDIKKALQFIEVNASWETKDAIKAIVSELADHLNSLADLLSEKDKEIEQAKQEQREKDAKIAEGFKDYHPYCYGESRLIAKAIREG